ncbi:hypothetical protein [Salinibacterium sp. ZJ454]|uniref:hypothetical protein n=1 Tax=Salinibacterium sp. ZJ454 TaxID=2708339 RepID=UPI001422EDAE|nr:hypothetical protein [Salinibacterium sp. ZJ454]
MDRHPVEDEPSVGDGAFRGARLILFGADGDQYAARTARRERMLALAPVDQTEAAIAEPARASRVRGVYWEYLQADDSPLLLRARDLADDDEARWDASRVLAAVPELRVLYTRDRVSGQLGWWLAREGEVVLVAPRVWGTTERSAVVRHARRALRALRTRPPWGEYRP